MLSLEKQRLIQDTYNELKTISATVKKLGFNFRTVVRYLHNKPPQRKCDPLEVAKVYNITGTLERTAKILNISRVTVWRNLKSQNINVGKGSSNWKKLYHTLRGRVSKSKWRQSILEKYNHKCAVCLNSSNIVHHIIKLSDLRDKVIKDYPHINPFGSYKELRYFTNLVMDLHTIEGGVVLCHQCHELEHYKTGLI